MITDLHNAYPTFNGKTINKPGGGDGERLIGMQFWSLNQQQLTLPVLCFMHICVYEIAIDCFNYMHGWTITLSQLMCYSESTFVKIIQVVLKRSSFFFSLDPTVCSDAGCVNEVIDNKAAVCGLTLVHGHKLVCSDHKKEIIGRSGWNEVSL